MGLRDLFKRAPKVEGDIGFFQLTAWWLSAFTDQERELIEERYRPLRDCNTKPLTQGKIYSSSGSPAQLLWGLASWFSSPSHRPIQRRILAKAQELAEAGQNSIEIHFTYQGLIQSFYKDREANPTALETAIQVCVAQIAIAPQVAKAFKREHEKLQKRTINSDRRHFHLPRHVGFEQLAIIREKQQDYAEAIRLSEMAMKQGWGGDFEGRIARCQKKLSKTKAASV